MEKHGISPETDAPESDGPELTYRNDLAASMHQTIQNMGELGFISAEKLLEFDEACLTPLQSYSPEAVKALRQRENVSQSVLAHSLGVAVNTVGQWERGERKPAGAAAKLLSLVERHGITYIR